MDVSTLSDEALPPEPGRRWTAVGATLGHRLLTGLVLVGASTAPGGWRPGPWDQCWAGGWDGRWTPDPDATDGPPGR
ncbi:hypothetical protein [Geodermatophilus sp. CPCC 206100]|uniref:hypothetical protein n=1 Tax=Geodermatophilus sp. CPCC 206100 TaxID=3020054 RepID=UPI003B00E483